MSGSLFLWMGHLFRGGSPKSGGVKIWVFLVKISTIWEKWRISCFLAKKGSNFVFWGGGRKTCPLKVDRIYGKTFCVVFTVGDFFGVVFSSFLVKNHQISHFFEFLGILDILTRDPSSQKPTPKNDPDDLATKNWPPKSDPDFGVKKRWKVTRISERKWVRFRGGKSEKFSGGKS